jgi:carbon monoxide dehydrogenase subunit G
MIFHMDVTMPVQPEAIWPIFFDIGRIAGLIPGCEQVEEKETLTLYSAVMKQKIGPFKMEAAAEVRVEEMVAPSLVRARAKGRDKFTGTTMDVMLQIMLQANETGGTRLTVDSELQVAGRLATLGYPIVKKKSEEMFVEFEKRLRAELGLIEMPPAAPQEAADAPAAL